MIFFGNNASFLCQLRKILYFSHCHISSRNVAKQAQGSGGLLLGGYILGGRLRVQPRLNVHIRLSFESRHGGLLFSRGGILVTRVVIGVQVVFPITDLQVVLLGVRVGVGVIASGFARTNVGVVVLAVFGGGGEGREGWRWTLHPAK